MSGFRDYIKGFFATVFGIGGNPEDEFIFFWDDEDEDVHTETVSRDFSFRQIVSNNQLEIYSSLTALLILMSLIFNNTNNFFLTQLPLLICLILLIVIFFHHQNRYKEPLSMVNSTMRRIKELDFTDTGEFSYLKNVPESLQNLDEFRASMAGMSEKLDDTTVELMNLLFVLEEKFRNVQYQIDSIANLVDRSGLSTVNYQEIKYYSAQVSDGVDNFTSAFDESLNSTEDVVGIVKSIGRQINMLALNAGIEAARAGEMGIGFEVVSNNLRRLSQHATSTTSEMKNIKGSINSTARKALETITDSMIKLSNNIDTSFSSFTTINNEIFAVKQGLSDISEDLSNVQLSINTIGTELQHLKK
jgi:methyl-accepting chemotaxis protein